MAHTSSIKKNRSQRFLQLLTTVLAAAAILSPKLSRSAEPELIKPGSSPRTVLDFDFNWRFAKGEFASAMTPDFDANSWRILSLPHDWSIEGPLGGDYASGTGFAPGGIGWYRKSFRIAPEVTNKLVVVEFDGVYDHAQVWINGHYLGGRPYGYTSFEFDLTPHLKRNSDNVLAVRVDHSRFSDSRWYTGSGIYRHVRLRLTEKLRVATWGTFITTPSVKQDSAVVRVETELRNDSANAAAFQLELQVFNPDGTLVTGHRALGNVPGGTNTVVTRDIVVPNPKRWSPETPHLYTLRTRLLAGNTAADETTTVFGIRTIRFDANKGFFLNDVPTKLKGVCLHHDAGAIGAAVPVKVWERRLLTLKEIGVNAIRTSHNPPAPELLDLCDRMGFLVKDEAFDEFTPAKNKWIAGWNSGAPSRFGYAENFEEWSVRDIQDMVRRDRNHPSIILWSIGNEIDYKNDPFSHPVLGNEYRPDHPPAENLVKHGKPLVAAVKQLDTTRPVTAALANVLMSDAVGFGDIFDTVGYNYQEHRYPEDHAKFPNRVIFGSENSHSWNAWLAVRDNEYISGQFLWTGIDYLGEAGRWPNHANGAGLLDLCGFKKPLAWFRQSLWSDKPMVYLSASGGGGFGGGQRRMRSDESWNWRSNSTVTVRCYSTCPEVELSLNGRVIGTKRASDAVEGVLSWEVPFEPGTLKAVGRDGTKQLAEFALITAGPAERIELLADTTKLSAATRDICHIEYRIVDANGVRVPNADHLVSFQVDGAAEILGIGNGDLNSTEDYKDSKHKALRGRGLLILQSAPGPGEITISATAEGLRPANVRLTVQNP